jgi:hypothetical protein
VWKYAGDEVLFWVAPASAEALGKDVDAAYEVLRDLDRDMAKDSEQGLRVKGTCWIALAEKEGPGEKTSPNLLLAQTRDGEATNLDFVGPDIDTGFRVSSCAFKSALAVSAELAAVLMEKASHPVAKKLHLMGFRKLKGVWRDRHYPIVWYRDDLNAEFDYDDKYENALLLEAVTADKERIDDLRAIVDKTRPNYVQQLIDGLVPAGAEFLPPPLLEVHVAAVGRRDDGRVLMARRPETKRTHRGKWEFGCAQLNIGETFEAALVRDYSADFGAELRFTDPATAIATYSFERDGRAVPGVILLAEVANPGDCAAKKHQDLRWVDPASPDADVLGNAVPGTSEVLQRVAKMPFSGQQSS